MQPLQKAAVDFLREHDKIAALLPNVARIAALQKQCNAELPPMFSACKVSQYSAGKLVLCAPNAALASKLKQQLPRLQNQLLASSWQINVIRIKVQVSTHSAPTFVKQAKLSTQAISSLSSLLDTLAPSTTNDTLKTALATILARHKNK